MYDILIHKIPHIIISSRHRNVLEKIMWFEKCVVEEVEDIPLPLPKSSRTIKKK